MKLSDTVTLEQVLAAHKEALDDLRYGKITWSQFPVDDRRAVLTRADLTGAVLTGADLTGADLTDADLRGADLRGAVLTGADLTGADLTDAVPPFEVPVVEKLDQRILDAVEGENAIGTLNMSDWHTCETTHCRAGWAITFAGGEGRMMEKILGSAAAGALIYAASRPNKPIPDFYASNEVALASIRADAAEAASA